MDCISPTKNKRRLGGGEYEHLHTQTKRLCNGLGGSGHVECGVVVDTPMDTWDAPNHNPQNGHNANVPGMVLPAPGRGAGQHCPRCMAGEPGHINHIMRY
ncbi:uncharacterized protein C10orf143 isoform X3 [Pimephales promelas]|uniref:uncharacterized protein C10orf143 isoform X3 n=1 Tax=Pimephales promelas TaxID=90988 RepID=UPI0019559DDB|nr:uncharacterized protein C10orf143 isoform X3 [Pimephales promelas]